MANKLGLKTLNGIQIVLLDVDPSGDTIGFSAPVGSQAYVNDGGVGKAFLKKDIGDLDWKKVADQDDIDGLDASQWSLGGNALEAEDTFGSTTNFDVSFIRDSAEYLSLETRGSVFSQDVIAKDSVFAIEDASNVEKAFFAATGAGDNIRIGTSVLGGVFEVAAGEGTPVAEFSEAGTSFSVSLDMGSNKITGIADPTSAQDVASKTYVDSLAAGLDPKESSRVATTADVGGTYNATGGTAGAGAFSGMSDTIDGILLVAGDRILVKDQTDAKQNGIYIVLTVGTGTDGTWERAEDHDGSPSAEVSAGNFTYVEVGNNNATTGWTLKGDGELLLNTDPIDWAQFSAAGSFTGGDGIDITSSVISVDADPGVFAFNSGVLDVAPDGIDGSHVKLLNAQTNGLRIRNGADSADVEVAYLSTSDILMLNGANEVHVRPNGVASAVFRPSEMFLLASLNFNSKTAVNLVDPVNAQDAATKNYVDSNFAPADSSASATTNDATQTTVFSEAIAEGEHKYFDIIVNGIDQTNGESAMYVRTVHAKRLSGGNAQIVLESTDFTSEEDTSWDVVIVADTTAQAIDIDVIGDAANSVAWTVEAEVRTF